MKSVILLPDSGPDVGLGHVGRCVALAQAFTALHWHASLAIEDASARRWAERSGIAATRSPTAGWYLAVVDSYRHPRSLAHDLRARAAHVAAIDDLHQLHARDVEAIVRPSIGERSARRILGGPQYILLRREHWRRRRPRISPRVRRILLTLGAYPPADLLRVVSREIHRAMGGIIIDVFSMTAGGSALSLTGAMARAGSEPILAGLRLADLTVTAGGQTMNESLAAGVPTIVLGVAENQRSHIESARRRGAIRFAGWADDARSLSRLRSALHALSLDAVGRRLLAERGRALVDGQGAIRTAKALASLL